MICQYLERKTIVSDLYNQDVSFDSTLFVRLLCANTKIVVPNYIEITFQAGWKNIVEELIKSISRYPIELVQISDLYSLLDVRFEVLKQTREVNIWRAIDQARQLSKTTCAQCGNDKNSWERNIPSHKLCKSCFKNSGRNNKTGTWLDKY